MKWAAFQPLIGGHMLGTSMAFGTKPQFILSYKDRVMSFEFAGLHYVAPDENKFAYRLVGFAKKWNFTEASTRFITYTNLNPGTYLLEAKAANNNGVWGDVTSLKITITPPFWYEWWFRIVATTAVVGFILLLYQLRTVNIRRKNRFLELII